MHITRRTELLVTENSGAEALRQWFPWSAGAACYPRSIRLITGRRSQMNGSLAPCRVVGLLIAFMLRAGSLISLVTIFLVYIHVYIYSVSAYIWASKLVVATLITSRRTHGHSRSLPLSLDCHSSIQVYFIPSGMPFSCLTVFKHIVR